MLIWFWYCTQSETNTWTNEHRCDSPHTAIDWLFVCAPVFFYHICSRWCAVFTIYGEWLGSRWEWALLRHQFHENSLERPNLEPEIAAQWFIHTVKSSNQFIHIISCSKRRRRRKKNSFKLFLFESRKIESLSSTSEFCLVFSSQTHFIDGME